MDLLVLREKKSQCITIYLFQKKKKVQQKLNNVLVSLEAKKVKDLSQRMMKLGNIGLKVTSYKGKKN